MNGKKNWKVKREKCKGRLIVTAAKMCVFTNKKKACCIVQEAYFQQIKK